MTSNQEKRIGILTFHNVTNYGAVIQAYALRQFVAHLTGRQVDVINYCPWRSIFYYFKRHFLVRLEFSYLLKCFYFWRFRVSNLSLSGAPLYFQNRLYSLSDRYDTWIVGSDEVWKIGKIRGWDSSYFLKFLGESKSFRRIAYAVSANSAAGLEERRREVKELVARFDFISARDKTTKDIYSNFFQVNPFDVLDPTLLHDFNIELPHENLSDYILVYGGISKKGSSALLRFSKSRGLKIVVVGESFPWADISLRVVSPARWLSLIKNAKLVVTNYYHGVLLSIKYKVDFMPVFSKQKMAKIGDIAQKLGFESKLAPTGFDGVDDLNPFVVEYTDELEGRLSALRVQSILFLTEALSIPLDRQKMLSIYPMTNQGSL